MSFYLDALGLTFCFVFTFFMRPQSSSRRRSTAAQQSYRQRQSDHDFSLRECLHLLGLLLVNVYQVHVCVVNLVDHGGPRADKSTSPKTTTRQIRRDVLHRGRTTENSQKTSSVSTGSRLQKFRISSLKKEKTATHCEESKSNFIEQEQPKCSSQDEQHSYLCSLKITETLTENTKKMSTSDSLQEQPMSSSLKKQTRSKSAKEQPRNTSLKEARRSISPLEQPKVTSLAEQPKVTSLAEQPKVTSLAEQPKATSLEEKQKITSLQKQQNSTCLLNELTSKSSQAKTKIAERYDDANILFHPVETNNSIVASSPSLLRTTYVSQNGYLKWEPEHKKLDLHSKTQKAAIASFNRFFNRQLNYYKENGYRDKDKYIFVITGHCKNRPGKVAKIKPEIQSILHNEHWSHFWFNNGGEVMIEFECEEDIEENEEFCDNFACNCYDDDDCMHLSD